MAEQLICNQQVDGSTPFTSSTRVPVFDLNSFQMGEFPSGQRGQTVNLLSLTSLVRIQLPPPTKKELLSTKSSFFVIQAAGLAYHRRTTCGAYYQPLWGCISSRASVHLACGLMIYNTSCWWYAIPCGIDDIQHFVLVIYNATHWWYTRLRRDWDARLRKVLELLLNHRLQQKTWSVEKHNAPWHWM